jgi:hypothetical protein
LLIITGTGRSGTAMMAKLLGGSHEFRVSYVLEKYFSETDPYSNPFDMIEKRISVVLDLLQGIESDTFVDSSNLYIHFIDAVHALYPSVKFILTVRDGRDFVRSAFSRRWHEKIMFGTVPQRDDLYFERWSTMTPLQKNAWIWSYRNKKAAEGLIVIPEKQKLVLRIEDITKKEVQNALEGFTDIKINRSITTIKSNVNPSFDFPPKEEWTDAQNLEFDEIAGDMMRFFGYK